MFGLCLLCTVHSLPLQRSEPYLRQLSWRMAFYLRRWESSKLLQLSWPVHWLSTLVCCPSRTLPWSLHESLVWSKCRQNRPASAGWGPFSFFSFPLSLAVSLISWVTWTAELLPLASLILHLREHEEENVLRRTAKRHQKCTPGLLHCSPNAVCATKTLKKIITYLRGKWSKSRFITSLSKLYTSKIKRPLRDALRNNST